MDHSYLHRGMPAVIEAPTANRSGVGDMTARSDDRILWTARPVRRARRTSWRATGLLAALLAGAPLHAQDTRAATPAASAPAADLSVAYTFDLWTNALGGIRRGSRYLDNLDVTLTLDGAGLVGWTGATLFAHGLYNNGVSLTDELVGDSQTVSNIDAGTRATRLYEFWLEQRLPGGRASLKFGLYDLNSEFDTNDSAGLFINSSHGIGPDFSQSGRNGPSIFPVTSLALRGNYELADGVTVRAAVLDAVPGDPDRPSRTAVRLGNGEGALVIAEFQYSDAATKAAIGHWRYSAAQEAVASQLDGVPRRLARNAGLYLLVERKLAAEVDAAQGLAAWVRVGAARPRLNPVGRYFGAGVVYTGALAGRDDDRLGLAIGWAEFGRPYRRAKHRIGDRSDRREINVEATYSAPIRPWLSLQPDIQFIVNPGGDPGLGDALVVGLRVAAQF